MVAGVMQGDMGNTFSGRSTGGRGSMYPARWSRSCSQNCATPCSRGRDSRNFITSGTDARFSTALFRNSIFDRVANAATLSNIAARDSLAYMLIILLGSNLPTIASVRPETAFLDRLLLIALPTMTLTLVIVAAMMH